MLTKYHREITHLALHPLFSELALKTIIKANIMQDRIAYMFHHDHIHFDGSAFASGFAYIAAQEVILLDAINKQDYQAAQKAFGRITHSWQDFYSHSNYVQLWMEKTGETDARAIIHNDMDIIHHSSLASGKNYGLIEFLAMVPVLSDCKTPHIPDDSHAKMNLDSPKSGKHFHFAYQAALKKTVEIYQHTMQLLETNQVDSLKISGFTGK